MIKTTRAQREALFKLFQRSYPAYVSPGRVRSVHEFGTFGTLRVGTYMYRKLRKSVQPYFGGDGCVIVPWAGMWVGIERDGYTHT